MDGFNLGTGNDAMRKTSGVYIYYITNPDDALKK